MDRGQGRTNMIRRLEGHPSNLLFMCLSGVAYFVKPAVFSARAIVLEQPNHLAGFQVQIHIVEDGASGQAGHGAHLAEQRKEESRTYTGTYLPDQNAKTSWGAFNVDVSSEG